jgi:hypothetical protein
VYVLPKAESDVLKPGLVIDDPSLLYPSPPTGLTSTVMAAIRRVDDNQNAAQLFPGTAQQVMRQLWCHQESG